MIASKGKDTWGWRDVLYWEVALSEHDAGGFCSQDTNSGKDLKGT